MTVGLAASVLIAGALGAAGWTWVERDRVARITARSAQVNTALQEATGLRGQAQGRRSGTSSPGPRRWPPHKRPASCSSPAWTARCAARSRPCWRRSPARRKEPRRPPEPAESDRRLLDKLVDIRSAKTDDPDGSISDLDYARAFREAGIDVTALPPAEAGARIKARPAPVAAALVAALDDWAAVRRSRR